MGQGWTVAHAGFAPRVIQTLEMLDIKQTDQVNITSMRS